MIKYINSFLDDWEVNYFIDLLTNSEISYHEDNVYKFYFLNLINLELKTKKFERFDFNKFRIQMTNETIDQIEASHGHSNPWSFVIFLNENFSGGEIVFGNRLFFPKKGDMIYFSGNEKHSVKNCFGNRYTLVGFMSNNPLNIEDNKSII
jgi:hypothetical protein